MAVRQLKSMTRDTRGTPKEGKLQNGGDLKQIAPSRRRHDNCACPGDFTVNLPEPSNRSGDRGHAKTRGAHQHGYSLPVLNENANQPLKFERSELSRDSEGGGRPDERAAREDGQHESRFSKANPVRSPGGDGATSRGLKLDATPPDELPLQCRSMPLTSKNFENCANCSRQMTFNPGEKYYDPLSGARPHCAHPPAALRRRPRPAPGRVTTWDHTFSGGGDVSRSHLLTQLSDPFRRPSGGSRRSIGDHGQQHAALYNKKAWGASTYSEPIGSRAFTYIDRVLRWLRKVPGNPLVNRIDCDGISQDTVSPSLHQAPVKSAATSRLSQPGSAWLQPCRADLTWPSHQNLPDAVASPQRSTPREPAARPSLYRPALSPTCPLPGEVNTCSYEKCSADGQFYPLNLIPSISHEKVDEGAHILNRSPRPPNPSPCSTGCPSLAEMTPHRLTGRKYSYSSVEELSFNSAECTHDVLSINDSVSPEPQEPSEPKPVLAKTLMIDIQPNVSVRYRKQKHAIKMRHALRRRAGKPSRRVPRHTIKKKPKKASKEPSVPPMPPAKCEKERKPRQASKKKKKKANGSSEIKKCIRLLKRKTKKRSADESEFVLRDLSSPCSVSSEYSLTVVEAFQRVVSMTAQMKIDGE